MARRQRDTTTGRVMEDMVIPSLIRGGYGVDRNVVVGTRFGVSKHRIDILAEDSQNRLHLVSLKWQQVQGTAEQKIPFEIICLAEALISDERFYKAHLVLGGNGWRYKDFYLSGGLSAHLANADMVSVTSLESFVGLANAGRL